MMGIRVSTNELSGEVGVERDGWGGNHKYFYFINISNEPLKDLEDVIFTH